MEYAHFMLVSKCRGHFDINLMSSVKESFLGGWKAYVAAVAPDDPWSLPFPRRYINTVWQVNSLIL